MTTWADSDRTPLSRRRFLRAGICGLGIGAALPHTFGATAVALAEPFVGESAEPYPERILVIVELAGGNDGLDTLIPYGDDAYHRARPTLRHAGRNLLRIDDYLAFHPALGALRGLFDDGLVAVVHGCGYPHPSRSHFSAMDHWHTAMPGGGASSGWIGRIADCCWPDGAPSTLVNIAKKPSLALRAQRHAPVVFSDPERLAGAAETAPGVREILRDYRSPTAYGATPLAADLRKVAALIGARSRARVYYTSLGGFDTHASQKSGRQPLLLGLGEALRSFHDDLRRLGRERDVAVMMFSEFGRRLEENASLGTDHGAAGPMFVMGSTIVPGCYGRHPSLTALEEGGDFAMTTDFRRVYATVAGEWLGCRDTGPLLGGRFEPLGIFS